MTRSKVPNMANSNILETAGRKREEEEGEEEKEYRQLQSIMHFMQTQEVNLAIYIVWQ